MTARDLAAALRRHGHELECRAGSVWCATVRARLTAAAERLFARADRVESS